MDIVKLNNIMILPSAPLHTTGSEARLSFSSAFQRSSPGLYARPLPTKDATPRERQYYVQHMKYQFRNCTMATWCPFIQKESFTNLYHHSKFNYNNKLRYITPRSELVGTGAPDAALPLSEPQVGSKIRGKLFYVATAVSALILFNLMVLVHPFVLLFDRYRRKAHYSIAKIWALATVAPFFKITVKGLENLPASDAPAVYVSNHQSFLDIYTLLTLGRSFKFISKTAIFLFPIVGWAMFLMGVIPLRRMDTKSQMECLKRCMDLVKKGASVFFFECLKRCMDLVKKGASVFFFPEGTRSKDGKLGVFKKGAFSIAAKCGVPVVPITLIGTGKIMPSGKEDILNQGSVSVIIHKPIQGKNTEALCNEARDIIAGGLIQG